MRRHAPLPVLMLVLALLVPELARAQEKQADAIPQPAVLLALLRGTLMALNQANITGNYSVLRDLATPSFRDANSSAALADRFRPWREGRLDFAAVLLLDAKLSAAPAIGSDGALRLRGHFPTAPLKIGFDIAFLPVDGHWRLGDIAAEPLEPEVTGSVARAVETPARPVPATPVQATATGTTATFSLPVLPPAASLGIPLPPGDRPRS
ncbi:hypothetical protein EV667_1216 [Ancylobacter aquaticus]|uniref:DUF2939 domain-containing protein n=1 Tax=Ancylobacter aquaticus TaxID=100 RepID=A0A4R1I9Y6_ANCAQ|nr:hypothetical protein [Ancylobacter aquaticus]TCK31111.1 hypothetical protein EV667_1216 [Ancylobacter aquaticus]